MKGRILYTKDAYHCVVCHAAAVAYAAALGIALRTQNRWN